MKISLNASGTFQIEDSMHNLHDQEKTHHLIYLAA